MKTEKIYRFFVFQKYGKFGSAPIGHFIKHKPLISEAWEVAVQSPGNRNWYDDSSVFNALFFEGTFLLKESHPNYSMWYNICSGKPQNRMLCLWFVPILKEKWCEGRLLVALYSKKRSSIMTKLHEIDHPEKKVDKNVVFAHYYMCIATLDSIESWWLPVLSDK